MATLWGWPFTSKGRFFAAKAVTSADQAWDERGFSDEDMDAWLNG